MTIWAPAEVRPGDSSPSGVHAQVFGKELGSEAAFEMIDAGLETSVLDNFLAVFPQATSAIGKVLGLSERSLARRRSQGRFTPTESDRLYRLVELFDLASTVLEGVEAAAEWMSSPAVALSGRTPLEYAHNEAGARRVTTLLQRIEHGVYS